MVEDERRLLLKIASDYYIKGMTQGEIASKFSMSRQKVNRIMGSLIAKGIVSIKINGYDESCLDLEEKLEKHFKLKQAIVIDTGGYNLIEKLGTATAGYLKDVIKNGMVIGVSWGKTLAAVVQSMPILKREDVSVVQCVGGKNDADTSIMADEIVRGMAYKLNASPYFMYAPAIVKDETTKRIIRYEETIKHVFSIIDKCNIALVGIGSVDEGSTIYKHKFLSKDEKNLLKNKGSVGDICFIPFNINGEIVETEISNRIIGIDATSLINIPLVIGVAGGEEKKRTVLGALKSGLLDVIITDSSTANYVLTSMES